MMKRLLTTLALILGALPAIAQEARNGIDIPLFSGYDLAATSYIYCATYGDSTDVAKEGWKVPDSRIRITTSGSSTTITSVAGLPAAFTNVAVGDELRLYRPQGAVANSTADNLAHRFVTARASATSITVNSAVDLGTTGTTFDFRTLTCGTGSTSGRFATDGFRNANVQFEYTVKNATSIDWRVECKVQGANNGWVVVIPSTGTSTNLTATAATSARIFDVSDYDYCRLGMQVNTDTGVNTTYGIVRLTR
jgi:hypothetical protein